MTSSSSTAATTSAAAAPSSLAAVPTAVWAVVGTLAVAAAGLGGALVMRSADTKAPAAPVAAQAATMPKFAPDDGVRPPVAQNTPAPAAQRAPAVKPAPHQSSNAPLATSRAAICSTCGTVESVQAVQEKGQGTGLGVAGGAVAGGVLGHQVGGGNGKTAMTVLGAVGGALAGNEVEKRVRSTTVYDVQVRMEDGSLRSFRRAEPIAAGARVVVEGNSLRTAGTVGNS